MKAMFSTRKLKNKTVIAAVILMLGAIGLLVCSPRSKAQEPNRQLVQTNAQRAGVVHRIALVIGNGAYTNAPPLKNPPNDARDMAATLKTLDFDVSSDVNVSQRDMKRLIREFGQKLKAGGNGLFYYAGHGVQARGRNYIIPVDADIQSEADVEDSGVDVGLVLNYMDDAQNGLNIVILDACRNNPFSRSFRSAREGLAQVDAPTGTLIAYATAPGRVAADGVGQNGLYTSELLKAMRLPGLSATDMFMQVRAEVMKRTGNKQMPWEASSLVGAFYFSGSPTNSRSSNDNTANNTAPSGTRFDAAAFEYNYWDSITTSTNADDFRAYLTKYPNGQFAELAKNRIKSLEVATRPAEPEPTSRNSGGAEIAFWDSVKNSSNPEDFRAYLKKYPNGEFAELAKNRLQPLEAAAKEQEAKRIAAELAKPIKTFKIDWGWRGAGVDLFSNGNLLIWGKKFQIEVDQVDWKRFSKDPKDQSSAQSSADYYNQTSQRVDCRAFKTARVDDFWIREIKYDSGSWRLRFHSAPEANEALGEIQRVCKASP
jgi:hypothetical protein